MSDHLTGQAYASAPWVTPKDKHDLLTPADKQMLAEPHVGTGSTAMVTVRPKKSKDVTISGEVVSMEDAKPENFALIYSPADEALPTILPVGPGGIATTVTT